MKQKKKKRVSGELKNVKHKYYIKREEKIQNINGC